MQKEMLEIIKKVRSLQQSEEAKRTGKLPSNAYFLNADEVVCFPRTFGDSRYPYACDGLTLWAYASGDVQIEESAFTVVSGWTTNEPNLAFFFGIENGKGFFPVSITGAARQPVEKGISRYTVYTPFAAYYIAESERIDGCAKLYIDGNKNVKMKVCVVNKSKETVNTYLSAYLRCILRHGQFESFEAKWFKSCRTLSDGFLFCVSEQMSRTVCVNHYAAVRREVDTFGYSTTSPSDYKGDGTRGLYAARSLFEGQFILNKPYCEFSENAIAGDMIPFTLSPQESKTAVYTVAVADDSAEAERLAAEQEKPIENVYQNIPELSIVTDGSVNSAALTYFLHNVLRQVEFCTRAKNYAGALIGIRDIFQQIECAALWIPDVCRRKIIEAIGFIGEDGRAPRQYTYPRNKTVPPMMDLRKFIDQGVWILSTVYTYLSITSDYSLLRERCGYYKLGDDTVEYSEKQDTVLEHLLRIADYLIGNLDAKTNCLHALYGDWNDALDGLGYTDDKDKEFGTGVSVMATMQLYRNLRELSDILAHEKFYDEKAAAYSAISEKIYAGLMRYAIDSDACGNKKILHGWGDKRTYKVGSFCDNDGASRDSATSNAFWVLSGLNERTDLKEHILRAYERLDDKYGIRTFQPYFALMNDKVGRIIRLPEGTAENAATYIHATLFAVWSLYEMGEYEKAEEQLRKILPLTHDFVSTTPFVMPNSYIYNKARGYDGESMNDWFTGSGCVLGKVLFFCVLGIRADLDGVTIKPAVSTFFQRVQTSLKIKGGTLTVTYVNAGKKKREFKINGKEILTKMEEVRLLNEELCGRQIAVEICD